MKKLGVSGNYRSSEGITGEEVWSTRAKWMDLYGNIGEEKISFTNGKEELNYTLLAGDSLTFKYRIIISSGNHLTDAEINTYAADFATKY